MTLFIGADVGGTFTDVFGIDLKTGVSHVFKVPSTPGDPSEAILAGVLSLLGKAGAKPDEVAQLAHGTTVGTNALLQRKGPRVALLTTAGFRDLLEIGRQTRPDNYDMHLDYPAPVVPRARRIEIAERVLADGSVHKALTAGEVDQAIDALRKCEAEAVAVCFLFSYLAPDHERAVKTALERALPGMAISLSSEVQPEFREYERFSTTAANAYLQPVMQRYLQNLRRRASAEIGSAEVFISQSSGGLMSLDAATNFPVRTALSGPAAGVAGALDVARAAKCPNLITFDMGGTSADVALIRDYKVGESFERRIGGLPIRLPMVDINTVGAGGGSIAWIDRDDLLKVGPLSAGAVPGPVCYGFGGTEPTVTDANVVLGRLSNRGLLGGAMKLDRAMAHEAIAQLGKTLGVSTERAARGIIAIVVSNMVRAIRVISVERGHDPRDFALLAFGGAGPLHARDVAVSLDIGEVIVPANPGILCAAGLISSNVRESFVVTMRRIVEDRSRDAVEAALARLVDDADRWFEREHVVMKERALSISLDLRYVGQNFELAIELPPTANRRRAVLPPIRKVRRQFFEAHDRAYGYFNPHDPVEIVNVRLTAWQKRPSIAAPKSPRATQRLARPTETRFVSFAAGRPMKTPVYDRGALQPGHKLSGPAVIEQMDTTTLVFPDDTLRVDGSGNLRITING
jgi:N-methylhydantoinase A